MTQDQLLSSLKKDVRSLLISSKHGLAPEQLKRDYQTMLGHPMPLKVLGFHNVLDMAKEMPDVVHVDLFGGRVVLKAIGDETTKGIEDLVSKQRSHKPKPKLKRGSPSTFLSHHPQHHRPFVLPRRGHPPPALPAQLRSQLRQVLSHGPVRLSDLEARYMACFGKPLQVMQYGFFSISEMLTAASDLLMVSQTRMGSLLILRHMLPATPSTAAAVFSRQPARISSPPIKPVPRETAALSNKKTEVQQSPNEAAAVCAQYTRSPSPVPKPVEEKQSFEKCVAKLEEQFRQRILENLDAGTVSQELKDKLRKVVAGQSQGMAIHNLPIEYKKMYGEDLPVAQLGFLSVTEMVGALSDIFCVKPCSEEGAKRLLIVEHNLSDKQPAFSSEDRPPSLNPSTEGYYFSCRKSAWEPEEGEEEATDSSESETEIMVTNKTIHQMVDIIPVMNVSCGSGIPLDALQCQKLKPPTRRTERELVPAIVERTESPSLFYVRFNESKEARTLENMMIEMRSCYTCPEVIKRYHLPCAFVRPGQVCCVAPRDMWFYRVVIHEVLSATEVQVYYVDFGDLSVVKRNSLCFLKSCYADLPAQAVPSVLAGIKPVKGIWTKEAISAFQKLCCERTLVAAAHSYHNNFLLLFLCDTHTEEDLYIHNALKTQGHGMFCSPASTPVFKQFNPITLYLGNDQLEKIGHFSNPQGVPNGHNQKHHQFQQDPSTFLTDGVKKQLTHNETEDLFDLPELEFISVAQVQKANPFGKLLNKDSSIFNNWDPEWTDRSSIEDEPKPLQNWQEDTSEAVSLSSAPSVNLTSETLPFCGYVEDSKQAQSTASTMQTLSVHTPGLLGSCRQQTDMSVESFHLPPTSILAFPVFKTGHRLGPETLFRRHSSPLALGPAARLAAGSNLLHWYPHKRA